MTNGPVFVTRATLPPFEEYVDMIRPLWESAWITNMGDLHGRLIGELQGYLGVPRVSLFTNGHLALELGLQAFGITGEVITSPFTFASTTHAIVRNGLEPVFCDIRADDYTLDAAHLESLITPRTTAIVPVHVYGTPCDVVGIQEVADRHGLKVIYDAAHAFGVRLGGVGIGNFGDASMFSFHATKVFNTIEGGCLTFVNGDLEKDLYHLKNFGIVSEDVVAAVGSNAKMNEFQAAMGLCNLHYLAESRATRGALEARYRHHLSGVPGLSFLPERADVEGNHAYLPVAVDPRAFGATRDEVVAHLKAEGIHPRKYFYPIVSAFDCYSGRFDPAATPVALASSLRVMTLPLHPELSPDTVDVICGLVLRAGRRTS